MTIRELRDELLLIQDKEAGQKVIKRFAEDPSTKKEDLEYALSIFESALIEKE